MRKRIWLRAIASAAVLLFGLVIVVNVGSVGRKRVATFMDSSSQAGYMGSDPDAESLSSSPSNLGYLGRESTVLKERGRAPLKSVGINLAEVPAPNPTGGSASGAAAVAQTSPSKLIRTGMVGLEVQDYDKAVRELADLAKATGGYVADSQVSRRPSGARFGTVSMRIPAERYDSAGTAIRRLGKLLEERTNIQDVTKDYADLETRLRVKRDAMSRIRELLRTRAGNLKEVLEAEKELSRLTEEIETAEGERRYLDHQIALSTINVELKEPQPMAVLRPSSWSSLVEAFRDSAGIVSDSLAFMFRLILILAPWAGGGLGVWYLFQWFRRRKRIEAAESGNEEGP